MSTFERPSAYDGCTSKPVVGVAIVWPIVCLEVAASVSTRRRQEADFKRDGPAGQSLLAVTPGETRSRPLPVIQAARESHRQRPVSEYSRLWPTAARMDLFSKAAAHGLAALIDIRCSRYVRSSINRTGAGDPEQS
jgi:hypothetical protein